MNNKKMNKKGFTIVELVIVIAVIAILAGVMIPTFGGIIRKANESGVQQTAASLWKTAYALDLSDGTLDGKEGEDEITSIVDGSKTYPVTYTASATATSFVYNDTAKGIEASFDGSKWSVHSHVYGTGASTDCTVTGCKTPEKP